MTRIKIFGLVLLTSVLIGNSLGLYISLLVFVVTVPSIIFKKLFKRYLSFLKQVSVVIGIMIAIQCISLFPLRFNYENVSFGLLASVRFLALTSLSFLFVSTTKISAISKSLSFLPSPLSATLLFSFALFTSLEKLFHQIRIAQLTRGHHHSWNILKSLLPLLIPLLSKSLRQAEKMAIAMETRGYKVQ